MFSVFINSSIKVLLIPHGLAAGYFGLVSIGTEVRVSDILFP